MSMTHLINPLNNLNCDCPNCPFLKTAVPGQVASISLSCSVGSYISLSSFNIITSSNSSFRLYTRDVQDLITTTNSLYYPSCSAITTSQCYSFNDATNSPLITATNTLFFNLLCDPLSPQNCSFSGSWVSTCLLDTMIQSSEESPLVCGLGGIDCLMNPTYVDSICNCSLSTTIAIQNTTSAKEVVIGLSESVLVMAAGNIIILLFIFLHTIWRYGWSNNNYDVYLHYIFHLIRLPLRFYVTGTIALEIFLSVYTIIFLAAFPDREAIAAYYIFVIDSALALFMGIILFIKGCVDNCFTKSSRAWNMYWCYVFMEERQLVIKFMAICYIVLILELASSLSIVLVYFYIGVRSWDLFMMIQLIVIRGLFCLSQEKRVVLMKKVLQPREVYDEFGMIIDPTSAKLISSSSLSSSSLSSSSMDSKQTKSVPFTTLSGMSSPNGTLSTTVGSRGYTTTTPSTVLASGRGIEPPPLPPRRPPQRFSSPVDPAAYRTVV